MTEELNLSQVIDFAVETEKLGEHMYKRLASRFKDDAELHELFETFAREETAHAARFETLRSLAKDLPSPSYEQKQYLRAVSLSDIFSDQNGVAKNIDQIKTREDALERAFRLEKTTLHYYQAVREFLDHEVVNEMIAEEKRHLTQVMKYMVTGAKMRGLGDKF